MPSPPENGEAVTPNHLNAAQTHASPNLIRLADHTDECQVPDEHLNKQPEVNPEVPDEFLGVFLAGSFGEIQHPSNNVDAPVAELESVAQKVVPASSPILTASRKHTWVPFFQHLKDEGKLDGNPEDLAQIQALSKKNPTLLKSYNVLRGNLSVQDEHQEMRQNLFGIIQEFMSVKHFTVHEIFGRHEEHDLRESWVLPGKPTNHNQSLEVRGGNQ